MKKSDEIYFWNHIKKEVGLYGSAGNSPRDIINKEGFSMHHKRAWYLLEKWADKGWYDCGVVLDLGWITPEGMHINL
jgi:hypothetical protein